MKSSTSLLGGLGLFFTEYSSRFLNHYSRARSTFTAFAMCTHEMLKLEVISSSHIHRTLSTHHCESHERCFTIFLRNNARLNCFQYQCWDIFFLNRKREREKWWTIFWYSSSTRSDIHHVTAFAHKINEITPVDDEMPKNIIQLCCSFTFTFNQQ